MIYWMSDKVNKVWDEKCPWLKGIVCEIHDEELKGHIVLQLELHVVAGLVLAVPVGAHAADLAPGDFVKEYENWDECCGPVLEDLEEVRDAFLKTLEEK